MCLGFFKFNKRNKQNVSAITFTRLSSDCAIQIHADNEYFPSSPVSHNSPSTDYSSAISCSSPTQSTDKPSLTTPPQLLRGNPKPLQFYNKQQNKHFIVISTSFHHTNQTCNNGCVYLYDISKNIYNSVPYPPNFKPEYHGHCIDDSGRLYIFFGRYGVFATLDLYTNKWDIKCINNEDNYAFYKYNIQNIWYPISYYIPFPINKIHIFGEKIGGNGNGTHTQYDELRNQFIELNVHYGKQYDSCCDLEEVKACYIQHKKQLFILNGDVYGRKTWCLDFNNVSVPKWKLLNIDKNSGDTVVLFDRLILIQRGDGIWCLDLSNDELVWIESEFKFNGLLMEDTNMIHQTDFYLHFMNFVYPSHLQIWFYYLLPYKIQCQFDRSVVLGYIKHEYYTLMPNVVVDIIGNYINLL